jgi:hypothetical protein
LDQTFQRNPKFALEISFLPVSCFLLQLGGCDCVSSVYFTMNQIFPSGFDDGGLRSLLDSNEFGPSTLSFLDGDSPLDLDIDELNQFSLPVLQEENLPSSLSERVKNTANLLNWLPANEDFLIENLRGDPAHWEMPEDTDDIVAKQIESRLFTKRSRTTKLTFLGKRRGRVSVHTAMALEQQGTPCDACRRRKSRCVPTGATFCVLCEFHKQQCTFDQHHLPRKRRSKLPYSAVKILDDWLAKHRENPYPTNAEKDHLITISGLTKKQVNTWLGNARRRQLDPLSAWLSASSEDEAVPVENILQAIETVARDENNRHASPTNFSMPVSANPDGTSNWMSTLRASLDNPKAVPSQNPADVASICSSPGSAFDQCPEARWSGPARRGRKGYVSPAFSSPGSISPSEATLASRHGISPVRFGPVIPPNANKGYNGLRTCRTGSTILPPLVPSMQPFAIHTVPANGSGEFKCDSSGCTAAPFQTQYLLK